ncbi:alanine racemase [Halobacillus sp. BBL2006]|uniref:alanine racemase n=1 Tax=Halobacillus sp. BBL2006 TaxID=1543706 RepID=UPI0005426B02|nr:alanine racemase [Halobacillus sp. BBL2006]KHE67737.1 alanine racemase [Halobacillus sp. BBL2006]
METFYRDSWVEVDLSAIEYNMNNLRKRLKPDTKIYAVVKANAYGHGDEQVAKKALESGADGLAVALLDEALKLRRAGFVCPLLVMGWTRPQDAPLAAELEISLTVFQEEWLKKVDPSALSKPLKLHMKWDTGMGRIGVRTTEEMDRILPIIKNQPSFVLEAVFTHFATADDARLDYFEEQERRFYKLLNHFERVWSENVEFHTGNSAASMRFPERMKNFVRFGISMYGLYPSDVVKEERPIDLKPAFSLQSRLVHVKKLEEQESISYGATYQTEDEEWIGTIPLGYADGWIRKLQGLEVLVDGKRHPIVGRICMDQFMIRLDQEYPIGTKVTLIGKQGDEEVTTDEVADYLETINYEVPCMISHRVPRLFIDGGQIVEINNPVK